MSSRTPCLFERLDDLPDDPIHFEDRGVADVVRCVGRELRVGDARLVDLVERQEQEERAVARLAHELVGTVDEDLGELLVVPPRGLAAGLVADARHAVDDGARVLCVADLAEQVLVFTAGGLGADLPLVVDFERVGRVEADDAPALNEDGRHAVVGRGHDERLVKSDVERAARDLAVPVDGLARLAEAEVPLADDRGGVAGGLERRRRSSASTSVMRAAASALRISARSFRIGQAPVSSE